MTAMFKVEKGALVPFDETAIKTMRLKGLKVGDVVSCKVSKVRNPRFNRLVHAIGRLCADNIEAFSGMTAHDVLKRIQIEANIECDESLMTIPNVGQVMMRQPRSLSFDKMDEGEFKQLAIGLCRFVAEKYWDGLSPEQVMQMAEKFIDD